MGKILSYLFTILVTVIVSEIFFYLTLTKPPTPSSYCPQATADSQTTTSLQSVTPTRMSQKADETFSKIRGVLPLKDLITSYIVNITRVGVLTTIERADNGIIPQEWRMDQTPGATPRYDLHITLESTKKTKQNFFYNKSDLKNLLVVNTKDGKETPATLDDIKIGDTLTVEVTLDLLKETAVNIVKLKISRML